MPEHQWGRIENHDIVRTRRPFPWSNLGKFFWGFVFGVLALYFIGAMANVAGWLAIPAIFIVVVLMRALFRLRSDTP